MHVTMNMPEEFDDPDGIARPYVITIDKTSREILAIRRNWYENDKKKKKRSTLRTLQISSWLGFYGTGLIHLIGGLLNPQRQSFANLLMLVHYLICLLVLKLAVFVLKVMTLLLCQVSSGTLMFQVVRYVIQLRSSLTKSHQEFSTRYLETLSKKDAGLAQLRIYKLET